MIYGAALNLIFRTITWFSQSASTVANHQSTLTQFQIRDIYCLSLISANEHLFGKGWDGFQLLFVIRASPQVVFPLLLPRGFINKSQQKDALKKTKKNVIVTVLSSQGKMPPYSSRAGRGTRTAGCTAALQASSLASPTSQMWSA